MAFDIHEKVLIEGIFFSFAVAYRMFEEKKKQKKMHSVIDANE